MLHHQPRPNVLIIVTDQQRANAVGYKTPWVITPNLDRLAASGVVCSAAFAQSPQCQPSRASLFTGRYPTAHRLWWNRLSLNKNELTIGNFLQKVGYNTGYFGKLHFGGDDHTSTARHFGFQHSFLYEDWVDSFSHFKTGRTTTELEFYGAMKTRTWTGRFTHKELHHEEVVTDRAVSFMTSTNHPYLCVVGYHGPHPPYAAPDEYSRLYDRDSIPIPAANRRISSDDWRTIKVQYYGAVSWIDSCVGRLIAATDSDTIIVFTSDHGDILGDHGLFSKGMYAYDGNVQVPLIVRSPNHAPTHYNHLVQLIDLAPTILAACGLDVPAGMQGRDLGDAFRTGNSINDYVMSMIGYAPRLRMLRTPRFKYWVCGEEEFLFDLENDRAEEFNCLSRTDDLARLRLMMIRALIRSEDPLPQPVG